MPTDKRSPKRSKEDLHAALAADIIAAASAAAERKAELRRADIHIRSAKLEADMAAYADAAQSLRDAADIYERHAGETIEIEG